jgi:hypothetical protein
VLIHQVEATKFTEVGFHGRDVDQIIRDLVDSAITLQRAKMRWVLGFACVTLPSASGACKFVVLGVWSHIQ